MMAVIWGTPTPATTRVVQMEPGPDAHLHRVGAGVDQGLRPPRRWRCCRPGSGPSGYFFLMARTVSMTFWLWPWAVSTTSRSTPASISSSTRSRRLGPHAHGGGHAQAALLVLAGVGIVQLLLDVLDGDQPAQFAARR